MKIIFKTFLFKKNIKRRFIVSIILFSLLFLLFNIRNTISGIIYDKLNIDDNKMINIVLNNEEDITIIKDISYIDNIFENGDEYVIIFKEYNDIDRFKEEYGDYLTKLSINYVDTSEVKDFEVVNLLLLIVIVITLISLFILTIFNMIETVLEEKEEIALYKLMGYKNKRICFMLFYVLLISYSLIYLISIIINLISVNIGNIFCHIAGFNYTYYFIIYLILFGVIIITNFITYLKIKNITPYGMKNSNRY